MNRRNYNVFFHTHTVSGIVISVALYVIFFAGAFALFKEEIQIWEEARHISHQERKNIDVDKILESLDDKYNLLGRDLQVRLAHFDDKASVLISPQKDSIHGEKDLENRFLYVDTNSLETKTYEEQYSLGEFLYRLHFFGQLPYVGAYLTGFISLFFLFAIVTGVIVHWKKIIPNFFKFNPKNILKKVWTDAHTALGIIGLPYQFIFAITGAYFGIGILALLPATLLYEGDQQKLIEDMRPDRAIVEWISLSDKEMPSVNEYIVKTNNYWESFEVKRVFIKNYGGSNMQYVISGDLLNKEKFVGIGRVVYSPYNNRILDIKNPNKLNYLEDSQYLMGNLHFGNFGGIWVKLIYFILAFITCFVIITGVLIWVEARNKKSETLKQRIYTTNIGHVYMAICLSLYPVISLFFLVVKLIPVTYHSDKMSILYNWFFIVWLLAIIFFRYKRDNYFTNKYTLLIGSILGFSIPIVNGIVSNNWFWMTYQTQQYEIFTVDVLWILVASTTLVIYFKIKPKIKEQSAYTKYPIDFKNRKELLEKEKPHKKSTKCIVLK